MDADSLLLEQLAYEQMLQLPEITAVSVTAVNSEDGTRLRPSQFQPALQLVGRTI